MSFDLPALREAVAAHGTLIRVLVIRTAGSVPRGAGTSMLVYADGQDGTIGGGALEFEATAKARAMLAEGDAASQTTMPLGPRLGQCCGGSVTLVWERFDRANLPQSLPFARSLSHVSDVVPARVVTRRTHMQPGQAPEMVEGWLIEAAPVPQQPLWIYGAGHVGRALVDVLHPMPGLAITWIDTGVDRFPDVIPPDVTQVVAADPVLLVRHAPRNADHLVLTYSHEMDLAICHALLSHDFASAGLIGSITKWARFKSRLAALGHSPARISAIACPIGDPTLGKHPQAIAVGVAVALLKSKAMTATQGDKVG